MAVRQGYKQTEVGVIPEDWDAVPIGRLGQFKNGINKGNEAFGHGSPFVNLMDVFGVSSITSGGGLGLVDTNAVEQKTYDLKSGDVIFIRSSVKPSGVGLTAVVEANLPNTVYSGFLIRFRDGGILDTGFKRHCFYSAAFRNKLIGASSVSANTNINQDNLRKLLLALPPTVAEQHAIANALSDVDSLLAKLDQFIAKKRDLKQAAMQQLLTGQTRLPGFSGEWEVNRLGESCELVTKGTTPTSIGRNFTKVGINFLKAESISASGKSIPDKVAFIDDETHRLLKRSQLMVDDLLISIAGVLGRVGLVEDSDLPANTNQALAIIRLGKESAVLRIFLFYCLRSPLIEKQISDFNVQAAQANISLQNVRDLMIHLPPTKVEQTAIATVLADMDTELAALQSRRDKTRALKLGMMQELLTGRIRLI